MTKEIPVSNDQSIHGRVAIPSWNSPSYSSLRHSFVIRISSFVILAATIPFSLSSYASVARGEQWKAGADKANITPQEYMWMSGYAARNKPAEGKLHDLWAKALVLEDPSGKRAVLVTLDLVGINRDLSLRIRKSLMDKHGLDISAIALCSSHTHSGPVVGENLRSMYVLDDRQQQLVRDYTADLEKKIAAAVDDAIQELAPATLRWGSGKATFAVNRRNNPEGEVPKLRAEGALKGPFDHDLPVLSVYGAGDKLKAIVAGYACHATTLDGYQWSGDWPGNAMIELEKAHPDALALVWAGCGADQNPIPRRKVELSEVYGRQLAKGTNEVLASSMQSIDGKLQTKYEEIDLALAELPTREQLQEEVKSQNRYIAGRAELLLERWGRDGKLAETYPYPVHVWKLGPDLTWVFLGGEVVVDFSLRLKQELGPRTWVAAYVNDVMAYIPSRRVLLEGGYEGGGAMVYYSMPGVWSPDVEEHIIATVKRLAK